MARSREQAAELIAGGQVMVGGQQAAKPATQVSRDAPIQVRHDDGDPGMSHAAATSWPARWRFSPTSA